MTLQTILAEKLADRDFKEIAKVLGYSSTDKLLSRTDQIINSDYLGLDSGGFDLHYSTPELIKKLCDILDIPALLVNKVIDETQTKLLAKKLAFKPHIFIETGFKRAGQSVISMAALQGRRFIEIPQDIQSLLLNDQISAIQTLIKQRYSEQPSLDLWGDVQQYVYYYDAHTIITFSTVGEILDVGSEYAYSSASLKM